MRHVLKTWPPYFQDILDCRKTFELRKDDRGFEVGDELLLCEYDPETKRLTGRELRCKVTYILRDPYLGPMGYVVMSIDEVQDA